MRCEKMAPKCARAAAYPCLGASRMAWWRQVLGQKNCSSFLSNAWSEFVIGQIPALELEWT
jgi:hypothetical protein